MRNDDEDLDSYSDVSSMIVPVRRPESDNDSSNEDNIPAANLTNNKRKVTHHRKASTEKIKYKSTESIQS